MCVGVTEEELVYDEEREGNIHRGRYHRREKDSKRKTLRREKGHLRAAKPLLCIFKFKDNKIELCRLLMH